MKCHDGTIWFPAMARRSRRSISLQGSDGGPAAVPTRSYSSSRSGQRLLARFERGVTRSNYLGQGWRNFQNRRMTAQPAIKSTREPGSGVATTGGGLGGDGGTEGGVRRGEEPQQGRGGK